MQARVKEQETQRKLLHLKRGVCIGGGLGLALLVWAMLIFSSKQGVLRICYVELEEDSALHQMAKATEQQRGQQQTRQRAGT